MLKLALLVAGLLPLSLRAQQVVADAHREANFLFEVKIIDEFIERFNDDPHSNLRREYARAGRTVPFDRKGLVKSLFDKAPEAGSEGSRFIEQVTDSAAPQKLAFNDSNWYAELRSSFIYNGQRIDIPLVLSVSTATDHSAKWMIIGMGDVPAAPAAAASKDAATSATPPAVNSHAQPFISPSDYATNFIELRNILSPGMKPENYFSPELLATPRGQAFVQMIASRKLRFDATGSMKFYFFQIPNYLFIVERFERQTTHSGWLISSLEPAADEEKQARISKLLQRS